METLFGYPMNFEEHPMCRCAIVPITNVCQWCGQTTDDDSSMHERCRAVRELVSEIELYNTGK